MVQRNATMRQGERAPPLASWGARLPRRAHGTRVAAARGSRSRVGVNLFGVSGRVRVARHYMFGTFEKTALASRRSAYCAVNGAYREATTGGTRRDVSD